MQKVKHLVGAHSVSRYLLIGTATFTADYTVLLAAYEVLKVPLEIATALGFIVGFLVSFTLNRKWAFAGAHHKRPVRQAIEYAFLLMFNLIFTIWGVTVLNGLGIAPAVGKMIIMGLILCWNYALFRWVIFAHKSKQTGS